jgi:hypothetical protein
MGVGRRLRMWMLRREVGLSRSVGGSGCHESVE